MDGRDLVPSCGHKRSDRVVVVATGEATCWVNKSGCLRRQGWQLRRGLIVRPFYIDNLKPNRKAVLQSKDLWALFASQNGCV